MPENPQSSSGFAMSAADFDAYWSAVEEHAIVAVTNRRGIIVYVNDRFCKVSGYSRQELIGESHRLVNSGHHSREFWRDLWQRISAGRPWHGEICNRARDGSEYWVDSTIVPLRRADRIFGYIAVRHLVTDLRHAREQQRRLEQRDAARESVLRSLRRAEGALRESERKFRYLYQAAPLAIARTSLRDGAFLEANPAFHEMTGYSAADLVGLTLHEVSPPGSGEAESQLLGELRSSGSFGPVERECIRKDGTRFQVLVHGMIDHTADGRHSVWSLAQDITERKRME
jgi:two-component system sensor histidine kinase/response regulator